MSKDLIEQSGMRLPELEPLLEINQLFLLSILNQLEIVRPWLNDRGFDFSLIRCKI